MEPISYYFVRRKLDQTQTKCCEEYTNTTNLNYTLLIGSCPPHLAGLLSVGAGESNLEENETSFVMARKIQISGFEDNGSPKSKRWLGSFMDDSSNRTSYLYKKKVLNFHIN
jgi:hypothetical protein